MPRASLRVAQRFPSALGATLLASAAFSLALAGEAQAAQITDVADAVDGDDPFDAYLEVKVDLLRESALITRENTQPPPGDPGGTPRSAYVKELSYERLKARIRPRLEIGIFHDLSIFAELPIVIWDQQTFRYADGTDATNSTLARDQLPNASPGVNGWDESEGAGNNNPAVQDGRYGFPGKGYNDWRTDHANNGSFQGYRQGFDNPTFGIRFSPLNNERDDTKPTITLQTDYTAPFFQFMDPTADVLDDTAAPGPVADGLHKFHFQVAMSKRYLILDPYFAVDYTLPLPAAGGGSLLGMGQRHNGGLTAGLEIVPYEDKALDQRFAIDVNAFAFYFSEGRDYSEISDVIREMSYTDQFVRAGVNAGLFFRAFSYFFLDLQGTLAYDTPHLLTIEDFGTDGPDENDKIDLDVISERNPYFNPALDTVGRRLRIEESLKLGVVIHLGVTF